MSIIVVGNNDRSYSMPSRRAGVMRGLGQLFCAIDHATKCTMCCRGSVLQLWHKHAHAHLQQSHRKDNVECIVPKATKFLGYYLPFALGSVLVIPWVSWCLLGFSDGLHCVGIEYEVESPLYLQTGAFGCVFLVLLHQQYLNWRARRANQAAE